MERKSYVAPVISAQGAVVAKTLGGINVPPFEAPLQHKVASAL